MTPCHSIILIGVTPSVIEEICVPVKFVEGNSMIGGPHEITIMQWHRWGGAGDADGTGRHPIIKGRDSATKGKKVMSSSLERRHP